MGWSGEDLGVDRLNVGSEKEGLRWFLQPRVGWEMALRGRGDQTFPKLHGGNELQPCPVPLQTLMNALEPPVSRDAETALAATGVPVDLASISTATGTPA